MEAAGPSSFSAKVYEGMIVGSQRREGDVPSNACKGRKLIGFASLVRAAQEVRCLPQKSGAS